MSKRYKIHLLCRIVDMNIPSQIGSIQIIASYKRKKRRRMKRG